MNSPVLPSGPVSESGSPRALALDPINFLEVERLATYEAVNAMLLMQTELQGRLGLRAEECQIFLLIMVATIQRFARMPNPDRTLLTREPLPMELTGAISRRRIADVLDVPLETVRRHVTRLMERGLIVERARGRLSSPGGMLARLGETDTPQKLAGHYLNVTNALIRMGSIRSADSRRPRRVP